MSPVTAPALELAPLADRASETLHGSGVDESYMQTASGLYVVGTLDIHRGERLPGEVLEGDWPRAEDDPRGAFPPASELSARQAYSSDWASTSRVVSPLDSPSGADMGRAYIFNVCVSPAFRRHGIASLMLRHAHGTALGDGVKAIYVHCEAYNTGAKSLYEREGYVYEKEESEWLASKLRRPRRILMRHRLAEDNLS